MRKLLADLVDLLLCLGLSNPPALAETPAGGGMKVNDTVFRDAAIANVTAVTEFEGLPVGEGRPGPVHARLSALLDADLVRVCGKVG